MTLALAATSLLGCTVTVTARTRTAGTMPRPVLIAPTVAPPVIAPTVAPTMVPLPTLEPTPEPTTVPTLVRAVAPPAPAAQVPITQPAAPVFPCPPPRNNPRPSYVAVNGPGPVLRPVIVQIDNALPARPALNLSRASTVFEYVAEGGVTRFSALFNEEDPGIVGPIRSARLASIEIARQFEALLTYHGASIGVQDRIWNGGIYFMSFNAVDSFSYHSRLPDRPVPHNSITRLPDIRRYAAAHAVPLRVDDWPDYPRGDVLAAPAGAASRLSVGFAGPTGAPWPDYRADFRFVPETGRYLRSTGGRDDIDGVTKQQISAATVVVQVAPVIVTDIVEDVLGSLSLDYQLQGEGKALYFRDGQYWEGCWRRTDPFAPTTFVGPDGNVFPLAKGPLWVAFASPNTPVTREA